MVRSVYGKMLQGCTLRWGSDGVTHRDSSSELITLIKRELLGRLGYVVKMGAVWKVIGHGCKPR